MGGTRALAGWEVRYPGLLKDSADRYRKGYLTLIEFIENRGIFMTSNLVSLGTTLCSIGDINTYASFYKFAHTKKV